MVIAMYLAHLVGDFILQWDNLAQWKSRELKGVLVHGLIIFLTTWFFSLFFDFGWWRGVLFISIAHILIDATQFYICLPVSPLIRLLIDQALHFIVITIALFAGGFLNPVDWSTNVASILEHETIFVFLLGYAFLTMPAWVLLKYSAYAFIEGTAPKFLDGRSKYYGIVERVLIATFVISGQFILIPLAALPRLFLEKAKLFDKSLSPVYLFELFFFFILAVGIGIGLRGM